MDITETVAPKSDQLNADDLIGAPVTVTITAVSRGDAEQPVNIEVAEFPGRMYRPCKSMRRVLVHAWGPDAATYVGRRLTLFNDQSVKWGGQDVGGIRISHMSHLDSRLRVALTVTRGKRAPFIVEPLGASAAISPDVVAEFERRIRESSTLPELDTVAADLKACDLGDRRDHLLTACRHRWHEIKTADAAPADDCPVDATVLRLAQIRKVEKLDDDEAWADYVLAATGTPLGDDGTLSGAQVAKLISIFDEDGAK